MTATAAPERMAVGFARLLRGAGLKAPTGSVLSFVEAIGHLDMADRSHVYWAGRATLVRQPEDIPLYDRAFDAFWLGRADDAIVEQPTEPLRITLAVDDDSDDGGDDGDTEANDDPQLTLRFSAVETLRHKDFSQYDADELVQVQILMSRLRFAGPPRQSLRMHRSKRGRRPDVHAMLRSSLKHGGEPVEQHWREPGDRLRRLVLLLDISGSMEPYARAMLRFVQAAVSGRQRVEAFAIGTRLTRLTRELDSRDPDKALRQAAARVQDWSGGTRLGDCMRTFNDLWGVRGMARGAIVVVLSDGWDRGDPAELGEQMQRLRRVAHHLVWVNPLKVTPGYAPLARGMAAALPHCHDFVEGHSLEAMERLADVISTGPGARR